MTLAYDVLSNATNRALYDRGEGDDSHVFEGRDFGSSLDLFDVAIPGSCIGAIGSSSCVFGAIA